MIRTIVPDSIDGMTSRGKVQKDCIIMVGGMEMYRGDIWSQLTGLDVLERWRCI
jgi:hypothetical protein